MQLQCVWSCVYTRNRLDFKPPRPRFFSYLAARRSSLLLYNVLSSSRVHTGPAGPTHSLSLSLSDKKRSTRYSGFFLSPAPVGRQNDRNGNRILRPVIPETPIRSEIVPPFTYYGVEEDGWGGGEGILFKNRKFSSADLVPFLTNSTAGADPLLLASSKYTRPG